MAVAFDKVLQLLRRKISDVDTAAAGAMTDDELLQRLDNSRLDLEARRVTSFELIVMMLDSSDPDYGFSSLPPGQTDLSAGQYAVLATKTALDILQDTFRGRLNRGELGIAWRSGPEEESSVQATRFYKEMIAEMENDLTELIAIYMRQTTGARKQ